MKRIGDSNPPDSVLSGQQVQIAKATLPSGAGVASDFTAQHECSDSDLEVRSSRRQSRQRVLVAGCTVGPKYRRPAAEVPATYKEVGDWNLPSRTIRASAQLWEMFQDPS